MGPIPDDVFLLLNRHIDQIDQLEILRILGEDMTREWDPPGLAAEVQTAPEVVASHLRVMQARGLLCVATRGPTTVCRYGPAGPDLEAVVGRLLQVYRERPVSMIRLVYAQARDPLRDFADAFRLRKEG